MSQAVSAAAPAQAPAQGNGQGSQGSSNAGGTASQGGDAGAFDYKSAFQSQNKKLQDTESNLHQLRQDWEGKRGDLDLVSKMKDVFSPPKSQAAESPVAGWERELDFYIEQAVEAKNQGRGIPLTANLAISHYKALIENYNIRQNLEGQLGEMKQRLEALSNPGHAMDQQAYSSFDTFIKNGLERIYGADQGTFPQRLAQFRAIGQQVAQAIKELRQKNPERWDMIRRDPREIEKLANRALRMNLPPKALQMIEQEQLRNTPMQPGELMQALREAKIAYKDNPAELSRVSQMIRREYLATTAAGGGSRRQG
jgi:hypothetical protein